MELKVQHNHVEYTVNLNTKNYLTSETIFNYGSRITYRVYCHILERMCRRFLTTIVKEKLYQVTIKMVDADFSSERSFFVDKETFIGVLSLTDFFNFLTTSEGV